jgi:hypothetical protein
MKARERRLPKAPPRGKRMADEPQTGSAPKGADHPVAESQPTPPVADNKAAANTAGKSTPEQTSTVREDMALATEKPVLVGPVKKHSLYVLTVDNDTGLPVKIEKLDEATNERTELSPKEYTQVLAYAGMSVSLAAGTSGYASAHVAESQSVAQAYYRGMIDYLNAYIPAR